MAAFRALMAYGQRRRLTSPSEGRSAFRAFLQCTPGLESALSSELGELGVGRRPHVEAGGISVWTSERELWTLATQSLLTDAIRVRVGGAFRATTFEQLIAGVGRSVAPALRAFVRDPQRASAVALRVRCKRSKLWHSGAVAQRVGEALKLTTPASGGAPPDVDPLTLSVRLLRDEVEASLEAASALHLRGCKPHSTDTSLRETVAAACARAAMDACGDAKPSSAALWDPFCGSGTMLIEAAMLAQRRAAGSALVQARRETAARLPLVRFASHDGAGYAAFLDEAVARASAAAQDAPTVSLYGSDMSARAIKASRHNVEHGLGSLASGGRVTLFDPCDFEAAAARVPPHATMLSNIPWHGNKGSEAEARLYARLGSLLRARAQDSGARAFVLSGNKHFVRLSGCTWRTVLRLRVGGSPVHLVELVPPGSPPNPTQDPASDET